MLDLPQFNVDEGIQRLREIEMLEQISHLRPTHPPLESPEDTSFTTTLSNKFVREAPAALRCLVIICLCKLDLT